MLLKDVGTKSLEFIQWNINVTITHIYRYEDSKLIAICLQCKDIKNAAISLNSEKLVQLLRTNSKRTSDVIDVPRCREPELA